MLSKKHRFPLTTEFDRIKKQGRIINGPLFGLLVAKPPTTNHQPQATRFGFIISTKIDKRSVVRHRIKRLLSEAARLNLDKIKHGHDFVFLAKKEIIGKSFREVKKEVEIRLERAGLLKGRR